MANDADLTLLQDSFESTYGFVIDLPSVVLFVVIFLNNGIKALFILVTGTLFGAMPVLFIAINGLVIGLAIRLINSPSLAAAGLLPHGIIEVPAILLAAALGIYLGTKLFNKIRGQDISIGQTLGASMKTFSLIVLPALFIAAGIEAFITPLAINLVSR